MVCSAKRAGGAAAKSGSARRKIEIRGTLHSILAASGYEETTLGDVGGIYGGRMYGSVINRPYNHYAINVNLPCGLENVDKLTTALFEIIKNARDSGVSQ